MARFEKGRSGNAKGRPPGVANQKKLREAIAKDLPEIIEVITASAKKGNLQACKLLLDRVIPPLKPEDSPVRVALTGDLSESARVILQAIGASTLTAGQGVRLLQGLAMAARVVEIDELERRVAELEKVHGRQAAGQPT